MNIKNPKYPKHHKVGSVTVSVFDESKPLKPKFRVRWYVGKTRESETFRIPVEADTFAIAKATELNNEFRPPSKRELAELSRKANLFDEAVDLLRPYNWQPLPAIHQFTTLLEEMGDDGVRLFAHLYGPRLARIRRLSVSQAINQYRNYVKARGQVSSGHLQNQSRCFNEFGEKFGQREIHQIECAELDEWLEEKELKASTHDTWLYALRRLFSHARDYLKALPQIIPTECELVRRKKSDREPGQVFSLPEIIQIGMCLPDQETQLAFSLILFGHLRHFEAQQLEAKHFRRNLAGVPYQINITAEIAKHKEGESMPRDITIKPNLGKILAVLLPKQGPIFKSKDVYARLRNIINNTSVGWKRNALRRCCTSYSVARGEEVKDVAASSGHTVAILKSNYLVPVDQDAANKYWRLTFNIARIARLPRHYQIPADKIKRPKKAIAPHDPGEQLRIFPADVLESLAA
jgi:hypothetical protein